MTLNDEIVDCEFPKLCELLGLLDERLSEIQSLISRSKDPDAEGLCDRGEYFIGVGFVAMQQYLVDTLLFTGVAKNEAYSMDSKGISGTSHIALINSAANWWKHEAEWWNGGEVPPAGEKTFLRVKEVADSNDYELSNVLAFLCGEEKLSLMGAVPHLIEWRQAVHRASLRTTEP